MCRGGVQDDFKTGYWKGAGTDLQDCDAEGPYPPIHERQTARPRCLLWVRNSCASAPRLLMARPGRSTRGRRGPMLGVKQTSRQGHEFDASDPELTFPWRGGKSASWGWSEHSIEGPTMAA